MSYIKVELDYPIEDGTQITFKAPAANTAVEGLKVYYPNVTDSAVTTTSKTFTFVDSANASFSTKNITAFAADSYVNVILNLTDSLAYVQNPTNNTVTQGLIDEVTTLATTYATTSKAGVVKVGSGLSVTSDGTLSSDISTATKDMAGVIKVGEGLSVTGDGTVSSDISTATKDTAGIIKVGDGLNVADDGGVNINFNSCVAFIEESESNLDSSKIYFALNDILYYYVWTSEKITFYTQNGIEIDSYSLSMSSTGLNCVYDNTLYVLLRPSSGSYVYMLTFTGTNVNVQQTALRLNFSHESSKIIVVDGLQVIFANNSSVYLYSTDNGVNWTQKSNLPTNVDGSQEFSVGNNIFCIDNVYGSIYKFNLNTASWTKQNVYVNVRDTDTTDYRDYRSYVFIPLEDNKIMLIYNGAQYPVSIMVYDENLTLIDQILFTGGTLNFISESNAIFKFGGSVYLPNRRKLSFKKIPSIDGGL